MNEQTKVLVEKYLTGNFFVSMYNFIKLYLKGQDVTELVKEYYLERDQDRRDEVVDNYVSAPDGDLSFTGNSGMCVPPEQRHRKDYSPTLGYDYEGSEEYEDYEDDNDVDLLTVAILANHASENPDTQVTDTPVFGGGGDFGGGGAGGGWEDNSTVTAEAGGSIGYEG